VKYSVFVTGKSNIQQASAPASTMKAVSGNQPHSLATTQVCQCACVVLNLYNCQFSYYVKSGLEVYTALMSIT